MTSILSTPAGGELPSAPNAAESQKSAVVSHHAVTARPLDAPGLDPKPSLYSEAPNAEFAVVKGAELERARAKLAGASGDKVEILRDMASAAQRLRNQQMGPLSTQINKKFAPTTEMTGTIVREVFEPRANTSEPVEVAPQGRRKPKKKKKGRRHEEARQVEQQRRQQRTSPAEPRVRVLFKPDEPRNENGDRNPKLYLSSEDFEGVANGARATVSPVVGSASRIEVDVKSYPASTAVGQVTLNGSGEPVLKAVSRLSAFKTIPFAAEDAPKLKALLAERKSEGSDQPIHAIVDVRNPTLAKRQAVFHDFAELNELGLYELDAFLSAGVQGTLSAPERAHAELVEAAPELSEVPEDYRDLRDAAWVATDNAGSRTDFNSQDPEQIQSFEERDDRFVLRYALAFADPHIGRGTPLSDKADRNQETGYLSGGDIPAISHSVANDKAVFLEGKDRLAVVVEAHVDKKTGALMFEDCDVYKAVVNNKWQGSYRQAQLHYALQGQNLEPKERERYEAAHEELTPDIKQQLDLGLKVHRLIDADFVARGGMKVGDSAGYEAEGVIRSLSVSACRVLGHVAAEAGVPSGFRIHEEPPERKLSRFRTFTEEVGIPWDADTQSFAEYLNSIPERVAERFSDRPDFDQADMAALADVIGIQGVRATTKATYSVEPGEHFGQASDVYAHGTASNRRTSGRLVLRAALTACELLKGREPSEPAPTAEQAEKIVSGAVDTQSRMDVAERMMPTIRDALSLREHKGAVLQAKLEWVDHGGMVFRTAEPEARIKVPINQIRDALNLNKSDIQVQHGAIRIDGALFTFNDTLPLQILEADPKFHRVVAMPWIPKFDGSVTSAND